MSFEVPGDYTKDDINNRFLGTGNKFAFTGMRRDEDALWYKDFGAGFWSGDFSFKCKLQVTSGDHAGLAPALTLSNVVDNLDSIRANAAENALSLVLRSETAAAVFWLFEIDGTNTYVDIFTGSLATDYWVEYKRVGSTFTALIYSDEFLTLIDTLSLALHNTDAFRYFDPVLSWNNGTTQAITGYIEDIDLGLPITAAAGRRRRLIGAN